MRNNSEIIRKLKDGDHDTFKELYYTYYSKLIGVGKKFNFKFLSPEDFVHETFLKIHDNRHKLNSDILIDKQIYVICKNIILNHIKKEKKNISFESSQVDFLINENYEDDDIVAKNSLQLKNLIDNLPKKRKEVFKLHKVSNYTYKEISHITKLSEKTIANHIYLANKFLSENIKK